MPAFNFKEQFAPDVESGRKCQTIRPIRKDGRDHCKVGDTLSLYTGQRTKDCRLLGHGECVECATVVLAEGHILYGDGMLTPADREAFAAADGFGSYAEMADWFKATYGELPFTGKLIKWSPTNELEAR